MDDCLPSDDNGVELTPVLRAVQAGFFGLAALAFSLCLYRIYKQEYVGSVRCVVKYGALACLFCFLVEHGCYIGLNFGHSAGYEVILTTSDIARELVLVMAHAFIMMAVYMTAQTAATLLQTGSDASGTKHTLLIMWLGEFVVLVGVCVARPLADLWSISVAFDVYTVLEFVGFSFILFTNLYQVRRCAASRLLV